MRPVFAIGVIHTHWGVYSCSIDVFANFFLHRLIFAIKIQIANSKWQLAGFTDTPECPFQIGNLLFPIPISDTRSSLTLRINLTY